MFPSLAKCFLTFFTKSIIKCISFSLIICFSVNTLTVYALEANTNASQNNTQKTKISLSSCENLKENEIYGNLPKIISDSLQEWKESNIETLVKQKWDDSKIEQEIDQAVDQAIKKLQKETKWFNKLTSNFNKSESEKLIEEVIKLAFQENKDLQASLERLSKNIAESFSQKIEEQIEKSTSQGIQCLTNYLNKTYPQFIVDQVKGKTDKIQNLEKVGGNQLDVTTDIASSEKFALGGIALIITSQIVRRLGQQITTRILGGIGERILGRFAVFAVPGIGEFVGAGLIITDTAYTLIQASTDGPLSEIAKQLKTIETKNSIRKEIESIINNVLDSNYIEDISSQIARDIERQWREFLQKYDKLKKIIENDKTGQFKGVIDSLAQNYQLDDIVTLVDKSVQNMSENQLVIAAVNEQLKRALLIDSKYWVILDYSNLEYLINYDNLAGKDLGKVIDLEIYKDIDPKTITSDLLHDLLSIPDDEIIKKLAKLDSLSRQILLKKIPKDDLVVISSQNEGDYLNKLANYLDQSTVDDKNKIIELLLNKNQYSFDKEFILLDLVNSPDIKKLFNFWNKIYEYRLLPFNFEINQQYLSSLREYINQFNQNENKKFVNLILFNDQQLANEKLVLNDLRESSDIETSLQFWQSIYDSNLVKFSSDFTKAYLSKISLTLNQINHAQHKKLITILLDKNRKISINFVMNDLVSNSETSDLIYFWQKLFKSELITFSQDFEYEYIVDLEEYISRLNKDDEVLFLKFVSDHTNLLSQEKETLNLIANSSNVEKAINFWKKKNTFRGKLLIPFQNIFNGEIPLKLIADNYGIKVRDFLTIIILILIMIVVIIFTILGVFNPINFLKFLFSTTTNLLRLGLSKIKIKKDKEEE